MVAKYPQNIMTGKPTINWVETKKLGTYVYNFNEHSHGFKFHLFWLTNKKIIKNKFYYQFKTVRSFKRTLAKKILAGHYHIFETINNDLKEIRRNRRRRIIKNNEFRRTRVSN